MTMRNCILLAGFFINFAFIEIEGRKSPRINVPSTIITKYEQENDEITLECKADKADVNIKYRWWKDERLIASGSGVNINENDGTLKFRMASKHEGDYKCLASNGEAVALSSSYFIKLKKFSVRLTELTVSDREYNYAKIDCKVDGDSSPHEFKWNQGTENSEPESIDMDEGRLFVDTKGTLHFTYLKPDDELRDGKSYYCMIASLPILAVAAKGDLKVEASSSVSGATIPALEYSNSGVKVKLYTDAILECVFGGYDPSSVYKIPKITWEGPDLKNIVTDNKKFKISEDGRQLTIFKVKEMDEGDYYCRGRNTAGESPKSKVTLDIISEPVWLTKDSQPTYMTEPEGKNVVYRCDAKSLPGDMPPRSPVWYFNGVKFVTGTKSSKFSFSPDQKSMTIHNVTKPDDIRCIQCKVKNNYGEKWGAGCLNVIEPIHITRKPPAIIDIKKGDAIDMTVQAYHPMEKVQKTWELGGRTYDYDQLPFFTEDGNKLTLNTSDLTNEEFANISGIYVCKVSHPYETVSIQTKVNLKPVAQKTKAEAPFDYWIIGLIIGILFLIALIVVLICCILRSQMDGDYDVDKKEDQAGYDQEKELEGAEFKDFVPHDDDHYDGKFPVGQDEDDHIKPLNGQKPIAPLAELERWGSESRSLDAYGAGDETDPYFNEDGSLVGQYSQRADQQKQKPVANGIPNGLPGHTRVPPRERFTPPHKPSPPSYTDQHPTYNRPPSSRRSVSPTSPGLDQSRDSRHSANPEHDVSRDSRPLAYPELDQSRDSRPRSQRSVTPSYNEQYSPSQRPSTIPMSAFRPAFADQRPSSGGAYPDDELPVNTSQYSENSRSYQPDRRYRRRSDHNSPNETTI